MTALTSDHLPILVELQKSQGEYLVSMNQKKHPFRYENCWDKDPKCAEIVSAIWRQRNELPLESHIAGQLNALGEALSLWNKRKRGYLRRSIREKHQQLERIHDAPLSDDHMDHLASIKADLDSLLEEEEPY
ncbi:hypothetical protein Droror1_Dr00025511 [Drosera rotundifolia]